MTNQVFATIKFLAFLVLLLLHDSILGQGFLQNYDYPNAIECFSTRQTSDGGYVMAGTKSYGTKIAYLAKTDVFGDTIWTKTYGGLASFEDRFHVVRQTTDGGYILLGRISSQGAGGEDIWLLKTDASGNSLWSKTYGGINNDIGLSMEITDDGGFIVAGFTESFGLGLKDVYLIKTDSMGDSTWTKTFGTTDYEAGFSVIQSSDGGFLIAGTQATSPTNTDVYLVKTDASGNLSWEKNIGDAVLTETANSLIETMDGGFAIAGDKQRVGPVKMAYLLKTNVSGDSLWSQTYGDTLSQNGLGHYLYEYLNTTMADGALQQNTAGNYCFSGFKSTSTSNYLSESFLTFTDSLGNLLNSKTYSAPTFGSMQITQDNGFILLGTGYDVNALQSHVFLVKTDSLGTLYSNLVEGLAYSDNNNNCNYQFGESPLSNINIAATRRSDNLTLWTTTQNDGRYSFELDSGVYDINVHSPYSYFTQFCAINSTLNYSGFYNHDTLDIPFTAQAYCPMLYVDVSTPFLRRCFPNTYTVNYCNYGTLSSSAVGIWVEMDPFLIVDSSSIPISSQTGDSLYFQVGSLGIGQCGSFQIHTTLSCSNTVVNQAHCVSASITPDTFCLSVANWDGANISVSGYCDVDSVRFLINNIGNGNMLTQKNYLVIEDNLIFRTMPYQLNSGASMEVTLPANGKTWRLEAYQTANHPWGEYVSASVEACQNGGSAFSIGYLTQLPTDNPSPFVAVDCQTSRNAYDPNAKSAQPEGYSQTMHYIHQNTDLAYTIQFQNTGNDTAFRVMLLDTLSPLLHPGSIVMASSSHPYTWELIEDGILKIVFNNIMLPDSNTNEEESNGFVKFHIDQQINNPLGSVIYNDAAIYFDFNPPIITNEIFHTIGENFILLSAIKTVEDEFINTIKVVPNPFSSSAYIELENKTIEEMSLDIFDNLGRKLKSINSHHNGRFEIQRDDLASGLYFFRIQAAGKLIGSGQMVIR